MRTLVGAIALLLIAAAIATAQQPQVTESKPEALSLPEAKLRPNYNAVLVLIEAEEQDIADLMEQLDNAISSRDVLRLERAIGERREQLQIEILELRHGQAVAANHVELAAQIAASIEQMKNPQPVAKRTTPVPTPAERARQN